MKGLCFSAIGLSTRMFIMVFILSMAVFVPMSLISYHAATRKIESRMTGEAFSVANLTMDRISAFIDNAQHLVFSITAGQNISIDDKDELITEFIRNYTENNQLISETIYYINTAGNVVCNRQLYYDIMGNPMLNTLAQKAWDYFGSMNWSQPYHSPLSGTTVAVVYPVESKTRERLGVLIVEINITEIQEILDRQLAASGRTYVLMTSEGNIITRDQHNTILAYSGGFYRNTIADGTREILTHSSEGVSRIDIDGRDLVIVRSRGNRIGWILYTVIDHKSFYTDLNSFADTQISTSLVWGLVLLLFAVFISRNFSTPIRNLINHMILYQNPETASPIPLFRHDEIGRLADSYNCLLDKIKNLVAEVKRKEQEKKEYELNMLQSQIQPHFLYNTLACISILAKQDRIDEVHDTISSLVNLLSFSFENPAELVYLSEELEAVEMYIQIQKIRYGNIFNIYFTVSNAAKTKKIPKLTLQPIIENAIISIIPNHQRDGKIFLSAVVKEGKLIIKIKDNGTGFKREGAKIFYKREINRRALDVFAHVGMINSDKRLRLYYGVEYGIFISGKDIEKNSVSVILPA
jgi:sensor histidine kinase YesM